MLTSRHTQERVQTILRTVGIHLTGDRPWDLRINDDRFYWRLLRDGSLGVGESYVDGWWDVERLDQFFCSRGDRGHSPSAGTVRSVAAVMERPAL